MPRALGHLLYNGTILLHHHIDVSFSSFIHLWDAMSQLHSRADHSSLSPRSRNDTIYTIAVLMASCLCGFVTFDGLLLAMGYLSSFATARTPGFEVWFPSLLDLGALLAMFLIASGLGGVVHTMLLIWLLPEVSSDLFERLSHNVKAWIVGAVGVAPISVIGSALMPGPLFARMGLAGFLSGLVFGGLVGSWHWRWFRLASRDMVLFIASTGLAWALGWAFSLAFFFR